MVGSIAGSMAGSMAGGMAGSMAGGMAGGIAGGMVGSMVVMGAAAALELVVFFDACLRADDALNIEDKIGIFS